MKRISLTLMFSILFLGCRTKTRPERVEISKESISPNGALVVRTFYCEGGGAAGYAFENVCLSRVGEDFDPLEGLLGRHKTWSGFSKIEAEWLDDAQLQISYCQPNGDAYREHNLVRVPTKLGVTIHYRVKNSDDSI